MFGVLAVRAGPTRKAREDDSRPLALVDAVHVDQDGREGFEGDGVHERSRVEASEP